MIKNNIFILCLGFLNFVVCLLLTILCVPELVPLAVNLNEEIVLLCSKWFLIINVISPVIVAFVHLIFCKNPTASFICKFIFTILLYENMLAFSYFSAGTNLAVGQVSEIPLAVSILLPIAMSALVMSAKIKRVKYNSILGIRTKYTKETEFLWKQIHLFASDVLLKCSVICVIICIPFIFLRFAYIGLVAIILSLLIGLIIINHESKKLYNKYQELKEHQEKHKKRMEEYEEMQQKNKG